MLDKKTKEELMQLPKEEMIEIYEALCELYDELGDRIRRATEYIKEKYDYILEDDTFLSHDERIDRKQITHILGILNKGDK